MKKNMFIKIVVGLIALTLVILGYSWCSWNMTHYTKEAKVIEIKSTIITVVDREGNCWAFEGKGYKINDNVKMTMNTNYTDSNIFDDEIENVQILIKD